jgi:small subunit ribosomal protein S5
MAEILEEGTQTLESHTIGIFRSAATVKGGRRFSFGALVVVGDRNGSVGLGYGKAPGVPAAIEKAQKDARKQMHKVTLHRNTIPHEVVGKFGASEVRLIPASPGTGVIAGGTVRAVLEFAGVRDVLTKSFRSNSQKNLAKATMAGLLKLRTKEQISALREIQIDTTRVDEIIEAGERFAPTSDAGETPKARGPVNVKDEQARAERGRGRGRGGGRGGRGGGGGGRGRGRGRDRDQQAQADDSTQDTQGQDSGDQSADSGSGSEASSNGGQGESQDKA